MNRPARAAALAATALLLSACGGEPEDTRPGQPVAHRRAAFKDLIKAFEPIGVMFRAEKFNSGKFKLQVSEVMARREAPWPYFQPDTNYPPSRSRPEVWSEPEKFERMKQDFFKATDQLAVVSGDDARAAEAAFRAVESTCKDCHQAFKNR